MHRLQGECKVAFHLSPVLLVGSHTVTGGAHDNHCNGIDKMEEDLSLFPHLSESSQEMKEFSMPVHILCKDRSSSTLSPCNRPTHIDSPVSN